MFSRVHTPIFEISIPYMNFSKTKHIGKLHVADSVFSCSIGKLTNFMLFSFSVLVK